MTGWKCSACGWATFDIDEMRSDVNWTEPDGTITLTCPRCGVEGRFEDAEWDVGDPVPDGYLVVRCAGDAHDEPYTFLAPEHRSAACPVCDKPTGTSYVGEHGEVPVQSIPEGWARQVNLAALHRRLVELARQVGAPLERRPDGWPLCPLCGEDELWSSHIDFAEYDVMAPSTPEDRRADTIAAIRGCYRCGWTPQPVGPLAAREVFWVLGEGIANLGRVPTRAEVFTKHQSVGPSTTVQWHAAPGRP